MSEELIKYRVSIGLSNGETITSEGQLKEDEFSEMVETLKYYGKLDTLFFTIDEKTTVFIDKEKFKNSKITLEIL